MIIFFPSYKCCGMLQWEENSTSGSVKYLKGITLFPIPHRWATNRPPLALVIHFNRMAPDEVQSSLEDELNIYLPILVLYRNAHLGPI